MADQRKWQFCIKCNVMFYDGLDKKGLCAGGGGHNAQGFVFVLPYDVPESAKAQANWRFCDKCFSMFFAASGNTGVCAAGGGHEARGFTYVLPHDVAESATSQAHWRFCDKCLSMFFDNAATKGACPADAAAGHHSQGFMFVLTHTDEFIAPTLHVWADSMRCHSETPGFALVESDEPFVLVAIIDLERRNQVGIPETEVVLYGPLQGVDDQENHSFAFRPFWNRPLKPESAIFLTAVLEHDEINPELTRTAVAAAVQAVVIATVGAPRARIVSEALSAMSAVAEPVSGHVVVNRLIGPPAEVRLTADDLAVAGSGSTARKVLRFSAYGDYSVHYLARRI